MKRDLKQILLSEKEMRKRDELIAELEEESKLLSDNQVNLLMAFMMGMQIGNQCTKKSITESLRKQ